MDINVLCDDCHECLSKTINLSEKNINDDTVCVIALGLYNNTTVEKLDLSNNYIGVNGMNELSECITHIIPLNYVDLSGNKSSPWGVYCAIIEHCCVNSLTLCGDEGMKRYIKEIIDSLQTNTTLQSLTLCKIRRIEVQSIESILSHNTTLKELNVTWGSSARGTKLLNKLLKPTLHGKMVNINICNIL